MSIKDRLLKAMGGTAVKATLQRPSWWESYSSSTTGAGSWTLSDTPAGWLAGSRNVWARNCIRARAALVASAPLKLYKYGTDGTDEEITDHPILDLLETPNPITGDDRNGFMRGIAEQRAVFGRALVLKARGTASLELYRLPVQHIVVEPDAKAYILGYAHTINNITYPRDTVIDMRYAAIDGSVDAESPTSIALQHISAYNAAEAASRAIDKRGGRTGGIVAYDSAMLNVDANRMASEWDKRMNDPENAGRDAHMPQGTTYVGGALSALQMQRDERSLRLTKSIMAAYSVPPAMAGDFSDASILANAAVQSKTFWELFGIDELHSIAEAINRGLLWMEYNGSYEAGLYLKHDLSEIAALQEDVTVVTERAVLLVSGGIASINEARQMVNLDKIDDAGADAVMRVTANTEPDPVEPPAPVVEPEPVKAGRTLLPIFDFVGMTATDATGKVLGPIDEMKRFGDHGGMKASKTAPLVIIAGKAHAVQDVRVVYGADPEPMPAQPVQQAQPVINVTMPPINVTNNMPQQVPANVTVEAAQVNVPEQAAPVVNVNVPQQAAPVVNIAPQAVNVAAPVVTVNVPDQPAPVVNVDVPRIVREKQQIIRGRDGLIASTDTTISYEEPSNE